MSAGASAPSDGLARAPALPADVLAPLRAALISRAGARAAETLAAADADAQRVLAVAADQAAAVVAQARQDGQAEADALMSVQTARTRQAARALVLGAQRELYDALRQRARTGVRSLLADPSRRARLVAVLARRLGDHARTRDLPDGGVHAETDDGRGIDASVEALVDAVISQMDLEPLWRAR